MVKHWSVGFSYRMTNEWKRYFLQPTNCFSYMQRIKNDNQRIENDNQRVQNDNKRVRSKNQRVDIEKALSRDESAYFWKHFYFFY